MNCTRRQGTSKTLDQLRSLNKSKSNLKTRSDKVPATVQDGGCPSMMDEQTEKHYTRRHQRATDQGNGVVLTLLLKEQIVGKM